MPAEQDTHELRQQVYDLQVRAKYTQAEVDALGAKGHAFKNEDGHYSYPIDDLEDLRNAIHAVGRGNADHDAIRKYIIHMAGVLSATDEIPDNWNSDGSLAEGKSLRADDMKTCPTCDGSGKIKAGTTTCPTCDGTGKVAADAQANANANAQIQGVQAALDRTSEALERQIALAQTAVSKSSLKVVHESMPAAFRGAMLQVREERVPVRREFELREVPNGAGGTNLKFTGFACVTDARYEMEDWLGTFGETVSKGSFTKTLNEGADCAFLLNHRGMTLARTKPGTMKLAEVTEPGLSPVTGVTGLHSEALFDPQNMYVQAMRSAVERGDLDEMSFAFRVMRQEWNDAYDERYINEVSVDKGDVSLVNYGANPHTGGTVDLRQRLDPRARGLSFAAVRAALVEIRAGKTISAATADTLTQALGHLDNAGDSTDNVRSLLGDLLNVDAEASQGDDTGDGEGPEENLGVVGLFYDASRDRARVEAMRYHGRAA